MEEHCFACHGYGSQEGGLAIDELLNASVADHADRWETVVRKLATRQMPPVGETRPEETDYDNIVSELAAELDRKAAEQPNPGRTDTFRRLNRTEYQNAIRDLLALEVDVSQLLPGDEASHGFDNITVTGLSPVLLDRYVSAAQKISRLAIGERAEPAAEKTYRVRPDVTQDTHIPGTPIGTRGGTAVRHNFPQDGEYEIQARLMRDRNEELEGLRDEHQLEVILDRKRVGLFEIERPRSGKRQVRRRESHDAGEGVRRPARCRRGVSQEVVLAVGNGSSAAQCSLQLLPPSSHWAGHLSGHHPRALPGKHPHRYAKSTSDFCLLSATKKARKWSALSEFF